MLRAEDYTVGWVSALPVELAAAAEMLDEEHPELPHDPNDDNIYTLGRIGHHNVVLACLPAGRHGTTPAATVAIQMRAKFPGIRFGLMVGVGGGVPRSTDIRLGDVVVSQPSAEHGGVVQYDSGTATASGFVRKGFLNAPPPILLNALSKLRANHLRHRSKVMEHLSVFDCLPRFQRANAGTDKLFESTYTHEGGPTCETCNEDHLVVRTPREKQAVEIHYGTVASGNQVIRNGITRDQLSAELGGVLCFEMEAAGLMNGFSCLVIRGICDYCDSHKNKSWQAYAAATAAAYAKDLLSVIPAPEVIKASTVKSSLVSLHHESAPRKTKVQTVQRSPPGPVFNTNYITRLAQIAYKLYSSFRGGEVTSSFVSELSDELFSLHCSLCHLSKCISDTGLASNNLDSRTSNVFKRPGVLILRCSDVLSELETFSSNQQHPEKQKNVGTVGLQSQSFPSGQWVSARNKLEQMHAEVQWCLSSIDILIDALLRSNRSPTRLDTTSKNGASEPLRSANYINEQTPGHSNPVEWRRHPPSVQTALPPRPISKVPAILDWMGSTTVPSVTSASPDPPTFSASTSSEGWLNTIRLQLAQWEFTAARSSQDKRFRQKYLYRALMSLNIYIGSLEDVTARRRLREELEQHGLIQVIVKMKSVVGDLVMLEKQAETYFDDKMEDGVVH
ncbi:nucleoside phosphorylase domain-containing protein [Aspergillus falconensis]